MNIYQPCSPSRVHLKPLPGSRQKNSCMHIYPMHAPWSKQTPEAREGTPPKYGHNAGFPQTLSCVFRCTCLRWTLLGPWDSCGAAPSMRFPKPKWGTDFASHARRYHQKQTNTKPCCWEEGVRGQNSEQCNSSPASLPSCCARRCRRPASRSLPDPLVHFPAGAQ